jgi:hypothetical protein
MVGSRTSLACRTDSIARRTLRRGTQPSIIRVNNSKIARVRGIRPDFQLNREITPRRRAVRVAEDERAIEAVAAPGIRAVVWRTRCEILFSVTYLSRRKAA